MKKIFFLIFLTGLLFACSSLLQSNELMKQTGIIERLEISTWQYGTHTLNDENGQVLFALRSSDIDLNKYQNRKVIIWGNKISGYPVDGGPVYIDVKKVEEISKQ